MNLQKLNKALDEAYSETGRLRIAIMRAVGRDPYDWPPSDEILIATAPSNNGFHRDGCAGGSRREQR